MGNATVVLVADDESIHMVSYRDYLEDHGFKVIAVSDAGSVKQHANLANVLIVDARLPTAQLEGLEVVADLISEGRLLPTVAVVFVSVHSEDDDLCQQKFRELPQLKGRFIWLQKYFELEMLYTTINEELKKRQDAPVSGKQGL